MNISTDICHVNTQAIRTFINVANKMPLMARRALTTQEVRDAALLRDAWRSRRDVLGLTQDKAAALMGFETQAAVSHYLNAKIPLNPSAKLKFADVLQMRPSEIWPSSRLDELHNDKIAELNQFDRAMVMLGRKIQALPKGDLRTNIEGSLTVVMETLGVELVMRNRRQPRPLPSGPKGGNRANIKIVQKREAK